MIKSAKGSHQTAAGVLLTTGLLMIASGSLALYMYSRYKNVETLLSKAQAPASGAVGVLPAEALPKDARVLMLVTVIAHSLVVAAGVVAVIMAAKQLGLHSGDTRAVYTADKVRETKATQIYLAVCGALLVVSGSVPLALYKAMEPSVAAAEAVVKAFPVEGALAQLPSAQVLKDMYYAQAVFTGLGGAALIYGIIAAAGKHMRASAAMFNRMLNRTALGRADRGAEDVGDSGRDYRELRGGE